MGRLVCFCNVNGVDIVAIMYLLGGCMRWVIGMMVFAMTGSMSCLYATPLQCHRNRPGLIGWRRNRSMMKTGKSAE